VDRHALIDNRVGFFKRAFQHRRRETCRAREYSSQPLRRPAAHRAERFFRVYYRRQWIVFHLDRSAASSAVARSTAADADHRLTTVTHLLIGQGVNFGRVGQRYRRAAAGELRDLLAVITA